MSEFRINFASRTTIKGQTLAYSIAESTGQMTQRALPLVEKKNKEFPKEIWEIYTHGSSSIKGLGAGLVLTSPNVEKTLMYALALTFNATNNEIEYESLITGLCLARGVGVTL